MRADPGTVANDGNAVGVRVVVRRQPFSSSVDSDEGTGFERDAATTHQARNIVRDRGRSLVRHEKGDSADVDVVRKIRRIHRSIGVVEDQGVQPRRVRRRLGQIGRGIEIAVDSEDQDIVLADRRVVVPVEGDDRIVPSFTDPRGTRRKNEGVRHDVDTGREPQSAPTPAVGRRWIRVGRHGVECRDADRLCFRVALVAARDDGHVPGTVAARAPVADRDEVVEPFLERPADLGGVVVGTGTPEEFRVDRCLRVGIGTGRLGCERFCRIGGIEPDPALAVDVVQNLLEDGGPLGQDSRVGVRETRTCGSLWKARRTDEEFAGVEGQSDLALFEGRGQVVTQSPTMFDLCVSDRRHRPRPIPLVRGYLRRRRWGRDGREPCCTAGR